MPIKLEKAHVWVLAAGAACFIANVIASWPGWLSPDSIDMLGQARSNGTISDWHSPLLVAAWRILGDQKFGPVIPYLLQLAAAWTGLTLIALRLARAGWRRAWLLLPSTFLIGSTWLWSWLLKDAFILSLLVLALGVATLGDVIHGKWASRCLMIAPALLLALTTVSRWYLLPALALAVFGLTRLSGWTVGWRIPLIALATYGIVCGLLMLVETQAVRPVASNVSAATMFLDVARVECVLGNPQARLQGDSLFPPDLVVRVADSDICSDYSPYAHDPLFAFGGELDESHYVMPTDREQMHEMQSVWLTTWRDHPGILLEARVKQAGRFLIASANVWWSPSGNLYGDFRESLPAGIGGGQEVGWPSRGGLLLVILASISAMGTALLTTLPFGFLTILVLPALAWLCTRHRGHFNRVSFQAVLLFPVVYLATMAFVTPSDDFRYVVPASVWGILVFVLAMVPWATSGRIDGPAGESAENFAGATDSSETTG